MNIHENQFFFTKIPTKKQQNQKYWTRVSERKNANKWKQTHNKLYIYISLCCFGCCSCYFYSCCCCNCCKMVIDGRYLMFFSLLFFFPGGCHSVSGLWLSIIEKWSAITNDDELICWKGWKNHSSVILRVKLAPTTFFFSVSTKNKKTIFSPYVSHLPIIYICRSFTKHAY